MEGYLIALLSTALGITLVSILTPEGSGGGIAKHVRLLSALLMICILIIPFEKLIQNLRHLTTGDLSFPGIENPNENDANDQFQSTLDEASKQYFTQSLTQMIESQFAISSGDLRCVINWRQEADTAVPTKVTVLLSGSAIWKDPHQIEAFVTELIGCECITAIE